MKLESIYATAINAAVAVDPRGKAAIFSDSAILCGDENSEIKSVLVGVDIGVGEVLLVEELRRQGKPVDLIISHHPLGDAVFNIPLLLDQHKFLLNKLGIDGLDEIFDAEAKKISRWIRETNCQRAVDVAKLLNIPLLCCHSVADNLAFNYLEGLLNEKQGKSLKYIVNTINEKNPALEAVIEVGAENNLFGGFYLDIIGANPLPSVCFAKLASAGVSSVIVMHVDEERISAAKKAKINLISLPHFAVDSLGMLILMDKINQDGSLNIIRCGGFNY